jgi:hypothetical protein
MLPRCALLCLQAQTKRDSVHKRPSFTADLLEAHAHRLHSARLADPGLMPV